MSISATLSFSIVPKSKVSIEKRPDGLLVYLMQRGSGPCRFGQYPIFMKDLVQKREIPLIGSIFSIPLGLPPGRENRCDPLQENCGDGACQKYERCSNDEDRLEAPRIKNLPVDKCPDPAAYEHVEGDQ